MRIRSTRPSFYRSRRVASVDWDARFILKGLESYVDDNGVGRNDIALIAGDLLQRDLVRDSPGTLRRLSEAISALSEAHLLHLYEVDGDELLFISWWDSTQYINKPNKGRFPRPDGTFEYKESEIGAPNRETPGKPRESPVGVGEERSRGVEEQTPSVDTSTKADPTKLAATPDGFDAFWDAYGKKRGKKAAIAKYRIALKKPGITPEFLLKAATEYVTWLKADGKHPEFAKDPERWLSSEAWTDERAGRPGTAAPARCLPTADELEEPPPFLTVEQYEAWRREKPGRR